MKRKWLFLVILFGFCRQGFAASPAPPQASEKNSIFSAMSQSAEAPATDSQVAGRIFGINVSASNYYFAKRVAYMFPRPWEENLSPADRERAIWEALILHYESFRRNITVSDEEMEARINSVLKNQKQTRKRIAL